MTFCYAPWTNIEILPDGKILPCCKFQDSFYTEKFNVTNDDIESYRSSETLKQIKLDFKNNTWPKGCDRCRIEESSGIPSKRQLDYQRWTTEYNNYDLNSGHLLTMSMSIGNTCNLKCIICSPHVSSLWAKEYEDLYKIKIPPITKFRKDAVATLIDITPNLIHMDIYGGEPFLSGMTEHRILLDHYIATGRADQITIHYTTNGIVWPKQEWFDRWKHFKEIDLQISIDGLGKKFDYIRFPGPWSDLEKNVSGYLEHERSETNFRISVAHTVSAFNVYYLDEFFNWCETVGLPKPWTGKLHNPEKLRPTIWPKYAKIAIINKLKSSPRSEVLAWAHHVETVDDSKLFDEFVKFIELHDNYRGISFKQTFKELTEYIP